MQANVTELQCDALAYGIRVPRDRDGNDGEKGMPRVPLCYRSCHIICLGYCDTIVPDRRSRR